MTNNTKLFYQEKMQVELFLSLHVVLFLIFVLGIIKKENFYLIMKGVCTAFLLL